MQWLGVRLPMLGMWVWALVQEDYTWLGHVLWLLSLRSGACEPQLLSPRATTAEAHVPGAHAPQQGGGVGAAVVGSGPRSLKLGRACACR